MIENLKNDIDIYLSIIREKGSAIKNRHEEFAELILKLKPYLTKEELMQYLGFLYEQENDEYAADVIDEILARIWGTCTPLLKIEW